MEPIVADQPFVKILQHLQEFLREVKKGKSDALTQRSKSKSNGCVGVNEFFYVLEMPAKPNLHGSPMKLSAKSGAARDNARWIPFL